MYVQKNKQAIHNECGNSFRDPGGLVIIPFLCGMLFGIFICLIVATHHGS